ncbi:hypothetical protein JL722_14786 [Aureococcus anophagefferens]|nr:hypothetical protein JL722_14786 [Aureococcus anophagefferens]
MASSPRQTFNGEQHEPRGAPVWIADGDALWVPATVENRKEAEDGSVEFEALAHLHEPAILEALKRRYDHKSIYTSVGSILLAVNPSSASRTCAPRRSSYRRVGARFASPDSCAAPLPHVYGVADKAYRAMLRGLVDAASGAASAPRTSPF